METVVYLYGQDKEILESTAKLMNESFGKFNNKATVQDVNKKCWEVIINVTYKAAPEIKDEEVAKCQDLNIFTKDARSLSTDTKNKIGFVNGDNIMKINPYSGQTGVLGHTTMGANSAVAANAQPVIFEETFHMLGFDEHYPTSLTQESIIPELRGSVMSSGGIEINPTFVHPVFFYTIADYFNVVEKSVNVTEKKNTDMTNKNLESTDKGEAFFDPKSKSSMDIAKSKEVVNSDNCKP